jgi:hypothetical protein
MVALDKPGFPHVTWPLKKSVVAVGVSPTADTAIVLHAKLPGDPSTATSVDDFIAKSYGYSLVDLASGFASLELTPVDPGPFAYALDGTKAYVAIDGGDAVIAPRALQIVNARTGIVTNNPLGSSPSARCVGGVRLAAPSARPRVVREPGERRAADGDGV